MATLKFLLNLMSVTLTENKLLLPVYFPYFFAYFIIFCWKPHVFGNILFVATLDTASSFSTAFFVVVCLFICFVTSLGYFSEVYFPSGMKTLVSLFGWHGTALGVCSHPGMTVVLERSLWLSFSLISLLSYLPHLALHSLLGLH